jgi:glycosyltransferase involved in cell wall biosynthesis
MRIGIAAPIDLRLLRDLFPPAVKLPRTIEFPLTSHLARALYDRGHEIVLFALSREVMKTQRIDGDRSSAYICPERRPRSEMLDFFRGERHGLRDAMRASGCDVIHAHWTYEFGLAAVESGLPCVVTAHDIPTKVLRFARHPYWLVKPLLAWPVLRRARCITAVSPYVAQALRGFVKPEREIIVIPNGATSEVFALYDERKRRTQGGAFRFASVLTGWSPLKNGARLIEAFGILRKVFGDRVELSMFGDGHETGGPAQQWSRRHHLEEGVEFVGPQPYDTLMTRLVQSADVLVHPSLEEAFCMAVLEAMAIGVPVIAGRQSGAIPWLLNGGKCGLLVDVASPKSIASGMRTLLEDNSMGSALAQSGRQKALDEFRLEGVAALYEDVLARAVQEQTHYFAAAELMV